MAISKHERWKIKKLGLWDFRSKSPKPEYKDYLEKEEKKAKLDEQRANREKFKSVPAKVNESLFPELPVIEGDTSQKTKYTDSNGVVVEISKKQRMKLKDIGLWDRFRKKPVETQPIVAKDSVQRQPLQPTANPKEVPSYENHPELAYRSTQGIEGVDHLLWVKEDRGGFGIIGRDGPIRDWQDNSQKILDQVITKGLVVQAGGNCGMYPRFYGNYFTEVYTFEPEPLSYKCLDHNLQDSKYKKFRAALGHKNNKVSVKVTGRRNNGTHRIEQHERQEGDLLVDQVTIDSLELPRCDLIHLDIEGMEDKAVEGAMQTIDKFFPVVVLERARGNARLKKRGYREVKLPRMDTMYVHPEALKRHRERQKKVLIIGSGVRDKEEINKLDLSNFTVVTINNSWMLDDRWDINVHAPDHPKDRRPESAPGKQIISTGGENGYSKAVQKFGGLRQCGYSVTLATSYWVLFNLKPDLVGFLGCDMNYKKADDGSTTFYGVGLDIKRRGEPDPDRMAKFYGKGKPEQYLRDVYMRFFEEAKKRNTEVVNFSTLEDSRLPYPKSKFLSS